MERHEHLDAVAAALREVPRSLPWTGMDALERLEVPTLVVGSRDEADPLHPLATAEEYARRLPNAELVVEDEGQTPLAWQGGRLSEAIAGPSSGGALHPDPLERHAVRRDHERPLDLGEATGAVERLPRKRRHQRERREALRSAAAAHESTIARPSPRRVQSERTNIARTRAGSVRGSSRRASPSASPEPV